MRNSQVESIKPHLLNGLETAKQNGASCAKLSFSQTESQEVEFENSRLKSSTTRQGMSYRVVVVVEGKIGVTGGNDPRALNEMVTRAIQLATAGSKAHFDTYPSPGKPVDIRTHSEKTLGLTPEKMVNACEDVIRDIQEYSRDLFICASASRSESESLLVTSGGVCHSDTSTRWSLYGHVQKTQGSDMLFSGYGRSWRDLTDLFSPQYISANVIRDLKDGETIAAPPNGNLPALLTPDLFRMMLWAFAMGINGRNVAKGDSPLGERIGKQIFDPSISIVDDPHLNYSPGSASIDSDGIPTQQIPIVEKGVLKTFLYDLDSAGLAGTHPTGNSGCSPYSLTTEPGTDDLQTLISGIDCGIWIKDLIGFGQSNIINGDFSCNVGLGYLIRKGTVVGRIKNTMVAGNIYDILKSGVTLGSDVDPVKRVPSALIEQISVHSAGEK